MPASFREEPDNGEPQDSHLQNGCRNAVEQVCLLPSKGVLRPNAKAIPMICIEGGQGAGGQVLYSSFLGVFVFVANGARLRCKFRQTQNTYPSPGPVLTFSHTPPVVVRPNVYLQNAGHGGLTSTGMKHTCTQVRRNDNPYLPPLNPFHSEGQTGQTFIKISLLFF